MAVDAQNPVNLVGDRLSDLQQRLGQARELFLSGRIQLRLAGRDYYAGANFAWIAKGHFTVMAAEHRDQVFTDDGEADLGWQLGAAYDFPIIPIVKIGAWGAYNRFGLDGADGLVDAYVLPGPPS